MTKEQFEEAQRIVATLDELKYSLEYIDATRVDEIIVKGVHTSKNGYTESGGVKVPYMKYNDETLSEVVDAIKVILNRKIKEFDERLEKL